MTNLTTWWNQTIAPTLGKREILAPTPAQLEAFKRAVELYTQGDEGRFCELFEDRARRSRAFFSRPDTLNYVGSFAWFFNYSQEAEDKLSKFMSETYCQPEADSGDVEVEVHGNGWWARGEDYPNGEEKQRLIAGYLEKLGKMTSRGRGASWVRERIPGERRKNE